MFNEASCPDEKTELIFQDLILNSVDWLLCEDLVFFGGARPFIQMTINLNPAAAGRKKDRK